MDSGRNHSFEFDFFAYCIRFMVVWRISDIMSTDTRSTMFSLRIWHAVRKQAYILSVQETRWSESLNIKKYLQYFSDAKKQVNNSASLVSYISFTTAEDKILKSLAKFR